jgi:hypothetical protein
MKGLAPERELEIELEYHQRKKRKKPDEDFIELWEAYEVLKAHGRNPQGYQWEDSD